MASGAKSTDGFRRRAPEGLRSKMQELLFEPGETGSKSEYNSPAVCPSPTAGAAVTLTPLRASRRSGRKSSLQLNSPKGEFPTSSVQKYVKSFLSRLPSGTAVDYSSEIASPAAGTTPMRSRSLESTFGLASPGGYGRFTPTSSPGGAALRREVSASPKPAGAKSLLKPLGDNHGSVSKGRELPALPAGLRRSSRDELGGKSVRSAEKPQVGLLPSRFFLPCARAFRGLASGFLVSC